MFVVPEQIGVEPLMIPGVAGLVFTIIDLVCAADVPQAFVAVTVIFPPVAFDVVLMLVVVDVPVHPPGTVHV